jgi:hypothetical protein
VSPSDADTPFVTVPTMPHAAEYHDAAARYTRLAENLHRQAAVLSGWSVASQVGSGPVAAAVAERLARVVGDLSAAADEMARLARVCGQRADVCALYRQAVRAWWARPEVERGQYPQQPFPWVPL